MTPNLIYLTADEVQGLRSLYVREPELAKPLAERVVLLPKVESPDFRASGDMSVTVDLRIKAPKPLKARKTICPTAWRKGHWSALDRQAAVLSQHGRELFEAEKSLLWRQGHPWSYVKDVLAGSILFRREQESSAAQPYGIEGVSS